MHCPVDGENLVTADRLGVAIDYCPKCRGVWLDRGKLDKLVERAANEYQPPFTETAQHQHQHQHQQEKLKKSWLGEICDWSPSLLTDLSTAR